MTTEGPGSIEQELEALAASVRSLLDEHARVEQELADPEVHSSPGRARSLTRRYSELDRVVRVWTRLETIADDLTAAHELAAADESFAAEAAELEDALGTERESLTAELRELLVPSDPDDGRDAIVEIRAGEGGDESALFAADLARMYERWAAAKGWSTEVLDAAHTELGGVRELTMALKSSQDGVYGWTKFEGGVHRVQRVPVTESQGRIHTSAAGVLVFPEADAPDEVDLPDNDLRIDVYRSSGPGGQSVNTTDSAVRITHLPTGITASCQNEKSQLQNKEAALRMLRARILAARAEEAAEAESAQRRSQVRTVDRSERVRTYNFPENRVTDHRTGYKAYNLDQVIDGRLDEVVESLRAAERASRLEDIG
ncbi:peptide chain release factor 1 [Brevibacterium jeotgali]|uniref:Peptide chain release factor 1 n=1 Tax=Brevibacterium jeotgali TaxID=1262550 RepID=A0A2H1L7L4_9MICO|nr:peptide chain release factor 1 [Brevibacterium jeotgali]TWC03176.1 peptide chain release factor 1 (bRF-1) [Brevibacterium jeotgali]SMY12765.1 bacterial peptide chain release factor 1 (bRF-1) [Brevibacterium jeotgali]